MTDTNESGQVKSGEINCLYCQQETAASCHKCGYQVCVKDLPKHRNGDFCQLWTVKFIPGVGRILVAIRDISPWERVLEDEALVMAPDNNPVCVGCLGKVDENSPRCKSCKWPICRDECSDSKDHLSECQIFTERDLRPSVQYWKRPHWMYTSLAVLRVLLAANKSEYGKEAVDGLMDHWDIRVQDKEVNEAVSKMSDFIQRGLKLDWITLDMVQHAFGVLKTNAVGLVDEEGRMLFPIVSILSHSCFANLEPVEDPGRRIVFRAKRKIKKGEELSMRYTSPLESKQAIREKLWREWYFWCSCQRCKSDDEFQSNLSSPQCKCGSFYRPRGEDGEIVDWICDSCDDKENIIDVKKREEEMLSNLEDKSQEELKDLLISLKTDPHFHKLYIAVIKMKLRFLSIVKLDGSPEILDLVHDSTQDVFQLLSIIDPGCSRLNGKYMQMMLESKMKLLQQKKKNSEIKDEDFREGLKELLRGKLLAAKMTSSLSKC